LDHSERDKTKKALLDYCGQDTLAMAKMIETLFVSHGSPIPPIGCIMAIADAPCPGRFPLRKNS